MEPGPNQNCLSALGRRLHRVVRPTRRPPRQCRHRRTSKPGWLSQGSIRTPTNRSQRDRGLSRARRLSLASVATRTGGGHNRLPEPWTWSKCCVSQKNFGRRSRNGQQDQEPRSFGRRGSCHPFRGDASTSAGLGVHVRRAAFRSPSSQLREAQEGWRATYPCEREISEISSWS